VPDLLGSELLFALLIGKRWHLRAGNTGGNARKDIFWIVAAAEGPWLGQVTRPGALAAISFEPLAGAALASLAMAFHATVTIFKQFLALLDALGRTFDLRAEINLFGGRLIVAGERLDVSRQVPHILLRKHIAPTRHRGARHAVAYHAKHVVIVGHHVFKIGCSNLVVAGRKVPRRGVEPVFSCTVTRALCTVAPGTTLVVYFLTLGSNTRFRCCRPRHK